MARRQKIQYPMMTRDELLEHLRRSVSDAKRRATHNKRYHAQQRAIGAHTALKNVRELVKMLPQ